jgi:Poly(ADP-ribose) polymerase catalytic domain.
MNDNLKAFFTKAVSFIGMLSFIPIQIFFANDSEVIGAASILFIVCAITFVIPYRMLTFEYWEYEDDTHYLYHGSRNENWWNILIQGLSLRPKKSVVRTGAMFGHGLYFATRAKKSIGYSSLKGSYWSGGTSLTGFLAVYKVAYKNPFNVYRHTPEYKLFTKENVHRLGADAIFASKDQGMLVNDEVVVYDDKQATIRYLIELA